MPDKQSALEPNNTALLVAMRKEARPLESLLGDLQPVGIPPLRAWQGHCAGHTVYLVEMGIGKVSAAVATAETIRQLAPRHLINIGVSGTLHPTLSVGDIAVATRYAHHDVSCGSDMPKGMVQGYPLFFEADPLFEGVREVHRGLIATGDHFLESREEMLAIQASFPEALAIDMESAAAAQTAYLYGERIAAVRLISDTPLVADGYEQYKHFWEGGHAAQGLTQIAHWLKTSIEAWANS